jgi:two-component system chemotaxis response regulator CheB
VGFARTPPPTALAGRIDILAVGASTGGPNALAEVFGALPADFPVPIVIVQHMPPVFTKLFADRLSASCRLPFREVHDGDLLLPGHAYVAPGDYHMRVVSDGRVKRLALDHGAQENSCRPAVDVLFRSVAEHFGSKSLAVVMTGMGQDGLRGCERIHERGGQVIVQNEATSVVWGMPGFVARAGIADAVLPLVELAPEVLRRVRRGPRSIEETHHVA